MLLIKTNSVWQAAIPNKSALQTAIQIVKCKDVWHIFNLVLSNSYSDAPALLCLGCTNPSQSQSQRVHKRLGLPSPEVQVILPTLLLIPKLTTLDAHHDAFLKYPRGNTDSNFNTGQHICIRTWTLHFSCVLLSVSHRQCPNCPNFLAAVGAESSLNRESH